MLIGIFLTVSLLYSHSNPYLTKEEKTWLSHHPVVRLGFDSSRPPYDFSDKKGEHKGILSSYYDYFETLLGVKFITVKTDSWSELMHLARQGEIDVVSGLIKNPERESYLDFSTPLFNVPLSVLTLKNTLVFEGLEDFENRRLAMVASHGGVEFIQKAYPHLSIITHDSLLDALEALENGLLDAIIGETHSLQYYILTHGLKEYHIAHTLPQSYTLHIGTDKNLPYLHAILQKALNTIDFETKQHFHQAWLHSYKTPFFKVWHGFLLAFLVFIAWLIFALKNRQLSNRLNVLQEKKGLAIAHLEVVSKALNAGIWIWYINEDKYITDLTFAKSLGYKEDEIPMTFDGFMNLIAPEDKSLVIAALKRHIEKIDFSYSAYCKLIHKNGQYKMFHSFGGILANDQYGLPSVLGGCHIASKVSNSEPKNTLLDKSTGLFSQYYYHDFMSVFLRHAREESLGVSLILFRLYNHDEFSYLKDDYLKQFGSLIFETIFTPNGFTFYMGGDVFCTICWCDNSEEISSLVEEIEKKATLPVRHGISYMAPGSYEDEDSLYQKAYANLSRELP